MTKKTYTFTKFICKPDHLLSYNISVKFMFRKLSLFLIPAILSSAINLLIIYLVNQWKETEKTMSSIFYAAFISAKSIFTCSKLTIETLEQDVKYVQS